MICVVMMQKINIHFDFDLNNDFFFYKKLLNNDLNNITFTLNIFF